MLTVRYRRLRVLALCGIMNIVLAQCGSWGSFWQTAEITSYSIPSRGITGVINGSRISLFAESYTTFTPEIATFTMLGSKATVGGVEQVSGVTANNYASTLKYTITGANSITRDYTVTLYAPLTISGLAAWYRADSLSLSDGATINTWNDSSVNGNHLTTSMGGNLPVLRTNQLNGKPVGRFSHSGADDGIYRASAAGFSGNSFATFLVLKHTPYNTLEQYIYTLDDGSLCTTVGLTQTLRMTTWNPDLAQPCVSYIESNTSPIPDTSGFHLLVASYNSSTPKLGYYLDGSLMVQSSPAITMPTVSYIALGNNGTGGDHSFDGDLAEFMVYSTAITDANRIKISCYLAYKYALTIAESCP